MLSWKCQYNQIIFYISNTTVGQFVIFPKEFIKWNAKRVVWENRINILYNKLNLSCMISLAILLTYASPQGPLSPPGAPCDVRSGQPMPGEDCFTVGWLCFFHSKHTSRAAFNQHTTTRLHLENASSTASNSAWIEILMRTLSLLIAALFSHFHPGISAITF